MCFSVWTYPTNQWHVTRSSEFTAPWYKIIRNKVVPCLPCAYHVAPYTRCTAGHVTADEEPVPCRRLQRTVPVNFIVQRPSKLSSALCEDAKTIKKYWKNGQPLTSISCIFLLYALGMHSVVLLRSLVLLFSRDGCSMLCGQYRNVITTC